MESEVKVFFLKKVLSLKENPPLKKENYHLGFIIFIKNKSLALVTKNWITSIYSSKDF